jgi:Uma2 family endonuclease
MENEVKEPALQYKFISAEAYLANEKAALEKHEFYKGEVFAMSGASLKHNQIFSKIFISIGNKLKGNRCRPYGSGLRIHIPKNSLYTYPDISIICGDPELTGEQFDTAVNPSVIIELLSKSTRNYDKGEKFTLYRDIDSLKEYILIDTEKIHVEKHLRFADNSWQLTEFKNIENIFTINTINIQVALNSIYEGLSFE